MDVNAPAQITTAPAQLITAPAQPPAKGVVVYTALFFYKKNADVVYETINLRYKQ